MDSFWFLVIALGVSVLGSLVVLVRHRSGRAPYDSMSEFNSRMDALAPASGRSKGLIQHTSIVRTSRPVVAPESRVEGESAVALEEERRLSEDGAAEAQTARDGVDPSGS